MKTILVISAFLVVATSVTAMPYWPSEDDAFFDYGDHTLPRPACTTSTMKGISS